jgi:hypothetical protein
MKRSPASGGKELACSSSAARFPGSFIVIPSGHDSAGRLEKRIVAASADVFTGFVATIVHGAGYLVRTAAVAWLVFEKLGVGLLRRAWFNLDLL